MYTRCEVGCEYLDLVISIDVYHKYRKTPQRLHTTGTKSSDGRPR